MAHAHNPSHNPHGRQHLSSSASWFRTRRSCNKPTAPSPLPLAHPKTRRHLRHSLQRSDVSRQADLDLRNAEAGIFRAEPDVARAHEVHRGPDAHPVDSGNNWLRAPFYGRKGLLQIESTVSRGRTGLQLVEGCLCEVGGDVKDLSPALHCMHNKVCRLQSWTTIRASGFSALSNVSVQSSEVHHRNLVPTISIPGMSFNPISGGLM